MLDTKSEIIENYLYVFVKNSALFTSQSQAMDLPKRAKFNCL